MENEHIFEGLDEWVEIQSSGSTDKPQLYKDDSAMIIGDVFFNDSAVFPPRNHEGLLIASPHENQLNEVQQRFSSLSSSSSLSSDGDADEKDEEENVKDKSGSRITMGLGCLSHRIGIIALRMRNYAFSKARIWLFASATTGVAALFFVFLLYMRSVQRQRRQVKQDNKQHLMLLIKEKDQKITELLLQIAQLNGILLARREVPVLRVS